jgi:hypothetical protein
VKGTTNDADARVIYSAQGANSSSVAIGASDGRLNLSSTSIVYPVTVTVRVYAERERTEFGWYTPGSRTYTITFNREGQQGAGILGVLPNDYTTLYPTGNLGTKNRGDSFTLGTTGLPGATNFNWYLDGSLLPSTDLSLTDNLDGTYSFGVNSSIGGGTHTLLLRFTKDGYFYGDEVYFRVER